jgi:hypothetical protein
MGVTSQVARDSWLDLVGSWLDLVGSWSDL